MCYALQPTVNVGAKFSLSHAGSQGSFPVRKRTGTLRIGERGRASLYGGLGAVPLAESRGRALVRGSGGSPPEAEGILLPKRAHLSLSFK